MRFIKIFLAFAMVMSISLAHAQNDPSIEHLVIHVPPSGVPLTLYNLDDTGTLAPLGSLDRFSIENLYMGDGSDIDWLIMQPEYMAISPNGQSVAFIASRNEDFALFIYTLGEAELRQFPAPGIGVLKWSPVGDALLLGASEDVYLNGFVPYVHDLYLFDLDTGSVTQLTVTPDFPETVFYWFPDGQAIFYAEFFQTCESPCIPIENYVRVDRSGQNAQALTDLESDLLSIVPATYSEYQIPCSAGNGIWNQAADRFYFVVDCSTGSQVPYSRVFSMTVYGETRFEFDIWTPFPDNDYISLASLELGPVSQFIYLNLNRIYSQDSLGIPSWSLIRVDSNTEWTSITARQENTHSYLFTSAISPDERWIAVAGYKVYFALVDLTDGQITTLEALEPICQLEWINTETLLYTEYSTDLCTEYIQLTSAIWLLNVMDLTRTQLMGDLDGHILLVP
jgi:Tol biopolymer transport system component